MTSALTTRAAARQGGDAAVPARSSSQGALGSTAPEAQLARASGRRWRPPERRRRPSGPRLPAGSGPAASAFEIPRARNGGAEALEEGSSASAEVGSLRSRLDLAVDRWLLECISDLARAATMVVLAMLGGRSGPRGRAAREPGQGLTAAAISVVVRARVTPGRPPASPPHRLHSRLSARSRFEPMADPSAPKIRLLPGLGPALSRSKSFDELVGQQAIIRTLQKRHRISSGPRTPTSSAGPGAWARPPRRESSPSELMTHGADSPYAGTPLPAEAAVGRDLPW